MNKNKNPIQRDKSETMNSLLEQTYDARSVGDWLELLRLVFAASNEGHWCWDVRTKTPWWSNRFLELSGYSEEELLPNINFLNSLLHPDEKECALRELINQLNTGQYYKAQHRLKTKEQGYRWFMITAAAKADANGNTLLIAGGLLDITEGKNSEAKLIQSKIELEQSQQLAQIGSWTWDMQKDRIIWSDSLCRLLGYDPNQFSTENDNVRSIIHPDDQELVYTAIQHALQGGRYDVNHRVIAADGSLRYVHELAEVQFDEDGKPNKMLGMVQDITQAKLDEDKKNSLEEQLRRTQKMEAVGNLAGGIAHDFNNILTPIMGYADMLLSDLTESDSESRDLAEQIAKGSNRAKDLIEQILLFSKQSEKERVPLVLDEIVTEALKLLTASIPATIEIIVNIEHPGCKITGDASQLHQLIINLCTNAWQVMEESGGTLTIELSRVAKGDADLKLHPVLTGETYVCLSISDTGQGIDESILDNIFEPFFSTKSMEKGSGLGLSVVHGIVRNHRGEIFVDSTPGKGTTFRVYLHLSDESVGNDLDSPQSVAIREASILLVDDNRDVATALKRMLEKMGHEVTLFYSGVATLENLEQNRNKYDLVISDLTMPDITGLELARRAHQIHSELPIIIMTGYDSSDSEELLKEIDTCKIVGKPVSMQILSQEVNAALSQSNGG